MQRPARRDSEEPPVGVEDVEQGEEVALVRAAPMKEHEQPFGLAGRGSQEMLECIRRHGRTLPAEASFLDPVRTGPGPCRSWNSLAP
jgi:hypothetical protein